MALKLKDFAEPASPRALEGGVTECATCDAYHLLSRELERYSRGELAGRSLLVAGNRGSGKSTIVRHAIDQIRRKAVTRGTRPKPQRRLLPVLLNGPDLLDSIPASSNGTNRGAHDQSDFLESALTLIARNLHHALIGEFSECYSRRVEAQKNVPLEMAAQLNIELEHGAEVALLRRYWGDAGCLDSGVLFKDAETSSPASKSEPPATQKNDSGDAVDATKPASPASQPASPTAQKDDSGDHSKAAEPASPAAQGHASGILVQAAEPGSPASPPSPPAAQKNDSGILLEAAAPAWKDQGARELLLLATAGEAYGIVCEKPAAPQDPAGTVKHVLPALAALPTGTLRLHGLIGLVPAAIVAGIMLSTGQSIHSAALGGAITGLAIFAVSGLLTMFSQAHRIIPEVSTANLDRLLDLLVERAGEAGLAPVFIVDELDKVEDLSARLDGLFKRCKHFVSDKTFFCFLSERVFGERISTLLSGWQYPKEATYFGEETFLRYTTDDLIKYLTQIFKPLKLEEDRDDFYFLCAVLLHESQMHIGILRQRLRSMVDQDGALREEPAVWKTEPAMVAAITIQLAVEYVLLSNRVGKVRNPRLERLLYDAVYYPSRQWKQGSAELRVDIESFRRYLREILPDRDARWLHGTAEFDWLYERMKEVVDLVAAPDELVVKAKGLLEVAAPKEPHLGFLTKLLVVCSGAQPVASPLELDVYRWLVLRTPAGMQPQSTALSKTVTEFYYLDQQAAALLDLDTLLRTFSSGHVSLDTLGAEPRWLILPNPWQEIKKLVDAWRAYRLGTVAEPSDDDRKTLLNYCEAVSENGGVLRFALFCAAMRKVNLEQALVDVWGDLNLASLQGEARFKALEKAAQSLRGSVPAELKPDHHEMLLCRADQLWKWLGTMRRFIQSLRP
jgi:hypothetical protein